MCGRYLLDIDIENLEIIYDIVNKGEVVYPGASGGLVYPTNNVPVIYQDRLGLMHWGYHLGAIKGPIINCRVETLMEKPAYIKALAKRRVLIPASAYYEWQNIGGIKKPYTISPQGHNPLSMAGVFFKSQDINKNPHYGFAVVTRPANADISSIHHRMPLLLDSKQAQQWRGQEPIRPQDLKQWLDASDSNMPIIISEGLQKNIDIIRTL